MMNDRFSADLRQHLLAKADERPAEGQLAAVVERLAVTAQRPSPVAWLTWFPRRMSLFPSAAVRYGLIAVALVIAIVAAAMFAGVSRPTRSTVFDGTWTSVDPGDGSTQLLVVGAGASPTVHFEDQFATGLACRADAVKVFTADGTGTITDDRLDVTFPDGGGCGLRTVDMGPGSYAYDQASDTIIDGAGIAWTRVQGGLPQPTRAPVTSPASPSPSTSGPPSPRPGETTFTSTIHGISIDRPFGWETRPATEPWTGGVPTFDSPAADVIFDPAYGKRLYLAMASQPYGNRTPDEWRDEIVKMLCGDGGMAFGSWTVDGTNGWVVGCGNNDGGVMVFSETRGYLIRLVADPNDLAQTYDFDWLKPLLETVDLRPEDAVNPAAPTPGPSTNPSSAECVDYRHGATYAQSVDPLTVTAILPAGTDNGWWSGSRDVFAVGSDTCLFSAAVELEVSLPFQLFGDACRWQETAVDVRSRGGAYATLSQNGLESTPSTDVTLGGYPASRFEISVPDGFDLTRCESGELRLWDSGPGRDAMIDPDRTVRVYLVDVRGLILGVTVTYSPGDERLPAHMAELDAILASLRIEPQ